jgi:hypothetical protein
MALNFEQENQFLALMAKSILAVWLSNSVVIESKALYYFRSFIQL